MLFKSLHQNIVKIEESSKIIFSPLIMQMSPAGDSLQKISHSMDSQWPSCKNFKGWIQIPLLPRNLSHQILPFKLCTMEVFGPHQVLIYIFKQIFLSLLFLLKKLALSFGIYVIYPFAEVGDLNGWKLVRIIICIENARYNTKLSGIKWHWILFINYNKWVILLSPERKILLTAI